MVLVIAVFALRQPSNTATSAGSSTRQPSTSTSAKSTASTAPSKSPSAATSSTPASATASTTSSTASSRALPLLVLNDTAVYHLAALAAAKYIAAGWTVSSSGNYTAPDGILSTCAYYDPTVSGSEAEASALKAQFPGIDRVEPKFGDLPAGPIVVVLTPGYQP